MRQNLSTEFRFISEKLFNDHHVDNIEMGYMNLMSKAEDINLLGELIKNFVEGQHKGLDNVYDLEDGFHKTIWR